MYSKKCAKEKLSDWRIIISNSASEVADVINALCTALKFWARYSTMLGSVCYGCWSCARFGTAMLLKLQGWLFPGLGKHRRSMENWFFPSSDVTTDVGAQNFSTKEPHFCVPSWVVMSLDGKNQFSMANLHLPKSGNSKPSISITLVVSKKNNLLTRVSL